jgi:hypothetical protein
MNWTGETQNSHRVNPQDVGQRIANGRRGEQKTPEGAPGTPQ